MKKVVVTSGAGSIGSHLAEELAKQGHHVIIIDDLSTGRMGNMEPLLEDTGAGISVSSQEDTEKVLTDMYRQYQESGQVAFSGDISKLAKLSHRELAQTFARLLNRLCP